MKKVLIFQEKIMPYRVPIFNLLASHTELTILTSSSKVPEGLQARIEVIKTHSFGRLKWLGSPFRRLVKINDVVFFPLVPSFLETWTNLRNHKFAYWGIGVPASYNIRYDSKGEHNVISFLAKRANACVFYSKYPIQKYKDMKFNTEKMFVANNTVIVEPIESEPIKDILLFIGSLYPQKKIEKLLEAYKIACSKDINTPKLVIIGDGDLRPSIETFIRQNSLDKKIKLTGEVYDEKIIRSYFSRALACISPDQAGLSVLKSMGYGVPYITHKDAITGGERLNIDNEKNGILLDNLEELPEVIMDIASNPSKYIQLGKAAKEYYHKFCTPEIMVDGFLKTIDYVISHS